MKEVDVNVNKLEAVEDGDRRKSQWLWFGLEGLEYLFFFDDRLSFLHPDTYCYTECFIIDYRNSSLILGIPRLPIPVLLPRRIPGLQFL